MHQYCDDEMKILLLPLLLGLMSPAIAHNDNNGGCSPHCENGRQNHNRGPGLSVDGR